MRSAISLALLLVLGGAISAEDKGEDSPLSPSLAAVKRGEFWYAVQDGEGKSMGFARLQLATHGEVGLRAEWELRIVSGGAPYEEERGAAFGADLRLLASAYTSGDTKVSADRDGDELVFKDAQGEPQRVKIGDDACSDMAFLFSPALPAREGYTFSRAIFTEAASFRPRGQDRLEVGAVENVKLPEGEVPARKVVIHRERGQISTWVNDAGEIVKADWGGGTTMLLHRESTRHLFTRPQPVYRETADSNAENLVLEGEFPGFTPQEMFDHWTKPELLAKWWGPPKAVIEGRVGGKYELTWTGETEEEIRWRLHGLIRQWEPGKLLAFRWSWVADPEPPEMLVRIEITAIEGGVKLHVTHGPHPEGEQGAAARKSHLQGWHHFGPRLRAMKPAPAAPGDSE
jgi:uncharacterized protein YndB with AHSA1/START domain